MIIDNSRKLTLDDTFRFSCYKGIECFNKCCNNLNLLLTPYDIIRIKNNLGLTSTEFLKEYTTWQIGPSTGLPVVVLKQINDKCPFVSDDGCTIYKDRPGACRLYPLVRMRSKSEEYYYVVREEFCAGFKEEKEWTVREWLEDQGAEKYNEMNDVFMELVLDIYSTGRKLSEDELKLFYVTCYNIDKFRELVLAKQEELEVSDEVLKDDEKLMMFGIDWLKQYFGENE
jgi:Fe-S-cluster containining protein